MDMAAPKTRVSVLEKGVVAETKTESEVDPCKGLGWTHRLSVDMKPQQVIYALQ